MRLGGFAPSDASFGAVVTSELTPGIQVVGEGGRIGNLLSPTIDLGLNLIPGGVGFKTSAWYGQGGVRISTSGSGVRPYLETQAGIARMHFGRFLLYTFLGSLPWCWALAYGGYHLGARWEELREAMRPFDIPIVIAVVAFAVWFVWRGVKNRGASPPLREDVAEAEATD